jgi:hypothetical protein
VLEALESFQRCNVCEILRSSSSPFVLKQLVETNHVTSHSRGELCLHSSRPGIPEPNPADRGQYVDTAGFDAICRPIPGCSRSASVGPMSGAPNSRNAAMVGMPE